ncbi:MAG TPA: hypothetical protein VHV76_05480 [Mycobacteriales bacterium]|nr:hypothetical protein [Mycobacteriales bacterium]
MRNLIESQAVEGHLPFTTSSALAAGLTVEELQGEHWRSLMPDVWVAATAPVDRPTWRDAARLVLPADSVLCGLSALAEHGVELRPDGDVSVHVATGVKHRRRSTAIVNHRLVLAPDEVAVLGRWMVTTAQRTAFDCVRWAEPSQALETADAIVRSELVQVDELLEWVERYPRLHGMCQVRAVAEALCGSAAA